MTRRRRRDADGPTPGSLADLQDDVDPEQAARSIALRRLTAAPRTAVELRDDLVSRGVDPEIAGGVVARFTEVGLVDDRAYAAMWVQSRSRTRGLARSVLRQELRRKGVADAEVADALLLVDDAGEREQARRLVERRVPSVHRLEPAARERRLVGMLVRRGYPSSVAFSVVREVLGAAHVDDVQMAD